MEAAVLLAHMFLLTTVGLSHGQDLPDVEPCETYREINEPWREPQQQQQQDRCDRTLSGWYAFRLGKDAAVIPQECVQDNACGGLVSMTVDLGEQQMPEVGENITAWLCGSYNVLSRVDCCVLRQEISIKHCADGTIIYRLSPQDRCPVSICATRVGEDIPEDFRANTGDHPLSMGPAPQPHVSATTLASTTTIKETTSEDLSTTTIVVNRPLVPEALTQTTPQSTSAATTTTSVVLNSTVTSSVRVSESTPAYNVSTATDDTVNSTITDSTSSMVNENTTLDEPDFGGDTTTTARTPSAEDEGSGDVTPDLRVSTASPSPGTSSQATHQTDTPIVPGVERTTTHTTTVSYTSTSQTIPDSQTQQTSSDSLSTSTTGAAITITQSPLLTTTSAVPTQTPTGNPGGTSSDVTTTPFITDVPLSAKVRFVLSGDFQEQAFEEAMLRFVCQTQQNQQTGDGDVICNRTLEVVVTIEENVPPSPRTIADVALLSPTISNTSGPAEYLFNKVRLEEKILKNHLGEINLTLVNYCLAKDPEKCDDFVNTPSMASTQPLFVQHKAVFIIVITIAALTLLGLFLVVAYFRCSRRGTWVLAADHEEKGEDSHLAVDSPMTDAQITQGEAETTLTANGDHASPPDQDIPAADEDNGWVVPLEQGLQAGGVAESSQDTHF